MSERKMWPWWAIILCLLVVELTSLQLGEWMGEWKGRIVGRAEQRKIDSAECAKQRVDEYQRWASSLSCPTSCTFTAPAPSANDWGWGLPARTFMGEGR